MQLTEENDIGYDARRIIEAGLSLDDAQYQVVKTVRETNAPVYGTMGEKLQ